MFQPIRFAVAIFVCLGLLVVSAHAKDYFVDQKHPKADDKNAGTEVLPFKTIQPAVKAAQPGDTIWVKAGNYEDFVLIDKSGTATRPITLSAWKDDRVRIGFLPRALLADGKWQPIAGSKSWQVKLTTDMPEDFMVVLNEKAILTFYQDGPPKDEKVNWASYRKSDRTLFFNANGKNPGELGRFEYGRKLRTSIASLFQLYADYWTIRKIEFSYCTEGLNVSGANSCVVEDCFFMHCYCRALFMSAKAIVIRRCNFYRCGSGISGCGPGNGHIMEDNMIVECGMAPEDDLFASIVPVYGSEGGGPIVFKGAMQGQLFIHNILSDNPGGGWYADCPGSQSSRIIGNAFWDNGNGIYNEADVNDTVTQGNVFYRNGIGSSVATRWNIIENLFFEGGVCWNNLDINPIRDGYMLLRRNAFINPPSNGYLIAYASGWGQYAWPEVLSNCIVDRNRIWQGKDAVLINDGGARKYKTLEDIRKEFDWERHGDVKPYDKDRDTVESAVKEMGGSVVTFRIPWGKHSGDARPMLANSRIDTHWPGAVLSTEISSVPCYFWRVADGNYVPSSQWARYVPHEYWLIPGGGENSQLTNGCRWYLDAEAKFPKDLEEKTPCHKGHFQEWGWKMNYTEGNAWLVVEGVEPNNMLPQGTGYWTPFLGAATGAKITVSLKMRGKGLVSSDKGSPAIWLQFTNETGQNRQRVFLVGKDDAGKMQHEELTKGNFDWTDVKQTVTAPKGAIRMALFMGVLPCKGTVCFDDIDIKTDTVASPAAQTPQEALPPRLPLERIKTVNIIDLSKLANRGLADQDANDGKGGWSDQGSAADMRALKTGKVKYGGVQFEIGAEPNCCVVLKSSNRNPGNLPEKVTIPIGKKLDTLFFLHAGAWTQQGCDVNFTYIIHYKDGKAVTLSVVGDILADWIADPVRRFPKENDTFSTAAATVPVPQFGQGTIYRMEWNAPAERRGVEIESIEFIGGGKTVPVLLGITGVTEW
jgi:hypothetical protein